MRKIVLFVALISLMGGLVGYGVPVIASTPTAHHRGYLPLVQGTGSNPPTMPLPTPIPLPTATPLPTGPTLANQSLPDKRVWAHNMIVFPPYNQGDSSSSFTYYKELYPLALKPFGNSPDRPGTGRIERMRAAGINGMQFWIAEPGMIGHLNGALEEADRYPGFLVAPDLELDDENTTVQFVTQYAADAANHPSAARINGKLVIYTYSGHNRGRTFWQNVRRRLNDANIPVYIIGDTGVVSWVFERPSPLFFEEFDAFHTFGSPDNLNYFDDLIDLMNANNKPYAGGVGPGYNREPDGGWTDAEGTLYFRRNWEAQLAAHIQWQNIATWNDFTEHTEVMQTSDWNWTRADLNAFYAAKLGALPLPDHLNTPQLYVTSPQHTRLNWSLRAEALIINTSNQTMTAKIQLLDSIGQPYGAAYTTQVAPQTAGAAQIPSSFILRSLPAQRFLRARATMYNQNGSEVQSVVSAPIVMYDTDQATDLRVLYYSIPAYKALPGNVGLAINGSPLAGNASASVTPPTGAAVRFAEVLQNTRQVKNMFNNAPYTTAVPRQIDTSVNGWQISSGNPAGFYVARVIDDGERVGYSDPIFVVEPNAGSGTGLQGEYFDNIDFTNPTSTRLDPYVDFWYGDGTPQGAQITNGDSYSVRWTGEIEAPVSGDYTFYVEADDEAQLLIDGQLVARGVYAKEGSGTIRLEAGSRHSIKLDFAEDYGGARVKLMWAYAGHPRHTIPTARLYPSMHPLR